MVGLAVVELHFRQVPKVGHSIGNRDHTVLASVQVDQSVHVLAHSIHLQVKLLGQLHSYTVVVAPGQNFSKVVLLARHKAGQLGGGVLALDRVDVRLETHVVGNANQLSGELVVAVEDANVVRRLEAARLVLRDGNKATLA